MTHTYFGLEVYQELPKNCQNKIKNKLEYYKLFSQGSDPFMFYQFFLTRKGKTIQRKMHTSNTQKFFLSIIQYIHDNNLIHDEAVMSYLYGYITHYYLDSFVHPYIFYKTKTFNPKDKTTYPYNALHQELEYMLDIYFIEKKEKINPQKFKIHQKVFQVTTFPETLKKTINDTIEESYHLKNIAPLYLKSIKHMKKFFFLANYDPYGIKLKIYSLIDKITPPFILHLKELSYYNTYPNPTPYLNLNHLPWHYPTDPNIKSKDSIKDLIHKAKKDAIKTIKIVTNMLETKEINTQKLKERFQDLSLKTGRPCQEERK